MDTRTGNKNQNLIVSLAELEELICSKCEKPLSVGPIKSRTCGRCPSNAERNLYLEELISRKYFPCINRLEGCRKMLRHYEVKEHEKSCPFTYHMCAICNLDGLSAYKLYMHFKKNHRELLTDQPEFEVSNFTKMIFMYYNEYNIFFVRVEPKRYFNTNNERFYNKTLVTVIPICSDYFARKIYISLQPEKSNLTLRLNFRKNTFLIIPPKLQLKLKIEYKTITNEDIYLQYEYNLKQRRLPKQLRRFIGYKPTFQGWKLLKISGTELYLFSPEPNELLKLFDKLEINLKCALCHQYFSDSLCYDPRIDLYICSDCASIQNIEFKCHKRASSLYSNLFIRCNAKRCKKYYNLMMYLNLKHEDYCEYQRRTKCPISVCRWKGKLHEMRSHFERDHPHYYLFTDDTVLTFEKVLKMKVNARSMVNIFVKLGNVFVQLICKQIKHLNGNINRHGQVKSIKCYAYGSPKASDIRHRLMKFSHETPVLKYFQTTVEIHRGEGIKVIEKVV